MNDAKETTGAVKATAWTPGPWRVSKCVQTNGLGVDEPLIEHGDEETTWPLIARVDYVGTTQEMEANARLIAAAPEMFKALQAICTDPYTTCSCSEVARHAIALATGKEL